MEEHRDLWWPSPTVQHARVVQVEPERPFRTVHGGELERFQVAYESWGTLNDDRSNAVLVIHPMTSDCHASGGYEDQAQGWWEALIGPGRVLDTERFFVICPNMLGGCYGTTGPRFPAPDGEPFLERFPLLTPLDLMRAQRAFLQQLGIERLARVVGPSMGGMVAWEWAIEAGDAVDQVVVVAAPLRTNAYQVGLNWLQRRGIELDLSGDDLAARSGQMIARGVGMLSYRSSSGLEEKFGREWFKKPGATLADRGMYNIESWLRHHGKRSARRFDPYTYALLSRAMDLHDVGQDRGGFVSALDRVRCHLLAVGISSDQLYTPAEVRLGADILSRLGRPVEYAEIRSPHGHDGFLLETDQLEVMFASASPRKKVLIARGGKHPVRTLRIGILGAGRVASALVEMLDDRREEMLEDPGLRIEIAGVATKDDGAKIPAALERLDVGHDAGALVDRDDVEVILDLTRGIDSRTFVERALRRGRSVVTPNKALIHVAGSELERIALEHGARLAYHNSIAAGWPVIFTFERRLSQEQVVRLETLPSTTCNVVLEAMELGQDYEAALARAEAEGLTEPDPLLDVTGWDATQKMILLVARSRGERLRPDQIATRGIDRLPAELVRHAPKLGYRVRMVGLFLAGETPICAVLPCGVRADGHLGQAPSRSNVVITIGESAGESVSIGSGAGVVPIASAVLGDLLGIVDPSRSWTGRYPPASTSPIPPRFRSHLIVSDGECRIVESSDDSSGVPLLDSWIEPAPGAPESQVP